MPNFPIGSKTPITSSKRKSVFLREWWLTKVEKESKIGVGGFVNKESLETRGMRLLGSPSSGRRRDIDTIDDGIQVFDSAAIAKRYDNSTLESGDGIIITISGCINKSRTLSYGFSPEVCDSFLSGFPYTWEDYATKSTFEKHANTTKQSLPVSFDDLPVTRVRDLLISESGSHALMNIVFRDILKHTEKSSLDQSVNLTEKVCKNSTGTEVDHNHDDDVCLSNLTKKMIEEDDNIDLQSGNSKETQDGGFMFDKLHKITLEKQLDELSKIYPRRSTRKRKRI